MSGEGARRTDDVELVEVEPDGGSPDTSGRSDDEVAGSAAVRVGWWRRYRWWLASGLVVLVGVTPSAVHAVQERVRLSQLAHVPGIVAPLDGPVHEQWSVDAPFQVIGEVGGVLLGTQTDEKGVTSVRGIDARTGRARWSVPVTVPNSTSGQCVLADGPVTGQDKAVLACLVVDEATPVSAPAGARVMGQPLQVHLATLDPRTGAVLGTFRADPVETISALGTDIVIASHQVDSRGAETTVRRWDPRTGSVAWTAHHPDTAGDGASSPSIQESGGVLLVQDGGDVWEVSASGAELRSWTGLPADGNYSLRRTAGGHVLLTTYGQIATTSGEASGGSGATGFEEEVKDLGVGTTFTLTSPVSTKAVVDDGSAPDLLLVPSAPSAAYDLRTGREIWRVHREIEAFVVLDGTVYTAGAGTVSAIDARTGTTRWTVHTGSSTNTGTLATDGRSIFVMTARGGSTASTVEALDLTDGTTTWTSTLSHTFAGLRMLGDHLAAFTNGNPGQVTALG